MNRFAVLTMALLAGLILPAASTAQESTITYQGQLRQGGTPFTGTANLEFALFDNLVAGNEIGSAQTRIDWPVEDGLFQVELDFGTASFDGSDRYLEVRVNGAPLSPRQRVTATPYALLAAGAAAGSVDGVAIDPTEIQLRVVGTCPAGEYVREVNQDGSVVCDSASGAGGTVTQVDTGTGLDGGPITDTGTISIAPGGVGATEIDATQVQRRVGAACPGGEFVQGINQDGTPVCDSAPNSGGTVTQVDTGAGLAGGPITDIGTIAVAPGGIGALEIDATQVQRRVATTCPGGEFVIAINQDGSTTCTSDPDFDGTVTQVDTGAGLVGGPITETGTISVAPGGIGSTEIDPAQVQSRVAGTCPAGEYVQQVGQDGSVICGVDADSGGTLIQLDTGAGLTGGPITDTGTISVAPGGIGTTEIDATQVQRRVAGTCPGGEYVQQVNQDGSVTCGIDAIGSVGWSLSGNAGTNPATDFLGTTDATPLVLRTDDAPALRIEPSTITSGSPALPITVNSISGSHSNAVLAGVRGATIAGGGVPAGADPDETIAERNYITDHYATVGGGTANQAGDDAGSVESAAYATVGGGLLNTASGFRSTVGGGGGNVASGSDSTIGGGSGNAAGFEATVGGGENNDARSLGSTVGGGQFNIARGINSTIGGGNSNEADGNNSTVGGGTSNDAIGVDSTVGGGLGNDATDDSATVAGGNFNDASGFTSTVSGGSRNTASSAYSAVAGGRDNCAGGAYSWAGGREAKVRPGSDSGGSRGGCEFVSLSGDADGDNGTFVWADSQSTEFVSTGENQFLVRATGGAGINTNTPLAPLTVQGAGKWNPSIGNGYGDFLVGDATYGLAIGVADGPGLGAGAVRFWPVGGNEAIVFTTASNHPDRTLTLSDDGLVGVRRNPVSNALEVAGNASKTAAGSWLANSDARIKTEVEDIDGALDRLLQVRPVTFRYTEAYRKAHSELDEARYYNVIAQEFARVFPEAVKGSGEYLPGLPETPDNEILQVDTHPAVITSIAAVQELAVRLERAESRNAMLESELARLRERQDGELADLRAELAMLREHIAPGMAEAGQR